MRGERARLTRVGCPPPPAHVSAQLEAAKKIIEDLLTPKDDENNDWKRSQLRELGSRRGPPACRSIAPSASCCLVRCIGGASVASEHFHFDFAFEARRKRTGVGAGAHPCGRAGMPTGARAQR